MVKCLAEYHTGHTLCPVPLGPYGALRTVKWPTYLHVKVLNTYSCLKAFYAQVAFGPSVLVGLYWTHACTTMP